MEIFLESAEISIARLIEHLEDKSSRFSAQNSIDITVEEAGILGPPLGELLKLPAGQAKDAAIAVRGWSVSEYTKKVGGFHAIKGSNGRIYYAILDRTTIIIHDNLHLSTGLADIELADKLGLGNFSTIAEASAAISSALQKHKFT